jgi:hypothetical protein
MKQRYYWILAILIILVLDIIYLSVFQAEKKLPGERELAPEVICSGGLCVSLSCKVDYEAVPEMSAFAKQVANLCEENYPKIKQILSDGKSQPPYQIIFKQKQANPGETRGSVVYLSSEWFVAHPDDLGAIVHEIAHVVQGYPSGQPFWLVEGIGDYVRYKLGFQNSWSYPHCGVGSESYDSGYWCSAAFLMFIEKNYNQDIIAELNEDLRKNRYQDSLFQSYAGKTIGALWQECKQADCTE